MPGRYSGYDDAMPGLIVSILAVLAILFGVAAIVLWMVVLHRVRRVVVDRPTVRRGLDHGPPPPDAPLVSVIVPAHNEERVIDDCIASLRRQAYPSLESIPVLDRCTDGTLAIAQRHAEDDDRVIIIENDNCPDGWAGKCNAARRGAERATGDYLLFTDADTSFEPELVRASVAIAVKRDFALFSLLSTLTVTRTFERVAQPVASMILVAMYPLERVDRGPRLSRPFANGQYMLFRRAEYDALGGHAAVKDDLLEDIAFARRIHEEGGRCGLLLADGMLRVSMYDSYSGFREGWKRIFIEACRRKPSRIRKQALRSVSIGTVLPALNIAAVGLGIGLLTTGFLWLGSATLLAGTAALISHQVALHAAYRMGGSPVSTAWMHPIGSLIIARVLREAANDLEARRPIRWGGREYVLEPRD